MSLVSEKIRKICEKLEKSGFGAVRRIGSQIILATTKEFEDVLSAVESGDCVAIPEGKSIDKEKDFYVIREYQGVDDI
ncbi:MAG: hypothetical protein H6622_13360 [Halobacteriovoraceae bacterium]|nr:hypothetical protein [Halobacteriovoraceae bacterium]